jgi:PTS system N-acetylglucosamine-specific IIC component
MGNNNLQVIVGTEAEEIAHAMKQMPGSEPVAASVAT